MKICLAAICLVAVAAAQDDGGLKKKVHAPVKVSSGPVTRAEAQATFAKLDGLIHTVLHVNISPRTMNGPANGSVTKPEVVAELLRTYKLTEPTFTNTPKAQTVDMGRLVATSAAEKASLLLLIKKGFIGRYSPLATGKASTLSIAEFGDSVGFFLVRLSECTHQSSTKWTPYLHGING